MVTINTIKYTEEEEKRVRLLKIWVKLGKVGGNFGKQATETFEEDWKKLQAYFLEERGFKWGMVMINKTMNVMEDYIKADEEEVEEPPCREDTFRTNNECVCEKKPDNDYPCLCDEVEEEAKQTEVDTICDRCGHEDIEWCMSDGCRDEEEEELDAWCYRCDKHFSADTEQGGDDGTEEEEWVCNSCFKDINNSTRIVEYN